MPVIASNASLAAVIEEINTGTRDRLKFPNLTITDEANGVVNAMQLGEDGPGVLKDQHISSADNTTTGSGAGITLNPGAASGTNQAGAPLRLSSGISTGNTGSGAVVVLTSVAGASGVQQNTQSDSWYFWGGDLAKALTPATNDTTDLGATTLRINKAHINGLTMREAANSQMGLATLVGGSVVVANTSVTANSRIYLSVQTAGGTQGFLRIAARTPGTSFTITSTSGTETSTVAWMIVEPT
jgi:hypothetical protein